MLLRLLLLRCYCYWYYLNVFLFFTVIIIFYIIMSINTFASIIIGKVNSIIDAIYKIINLILIFLLSIFFSFR